MKHNHGSMTAQESSSAKALRERAEMLVQVSEQTGLPLDNSGPPELDQVIADVRRASARSV